MKLSKSCLKSLTRNTRLRLKENACKHLKKREWLFNKLEKDMVYLLDDSGLFGIGSEDREHRLGESSFVIPLGSV